MMNAVAASGYAPLLVTNIALSDADREQAIAVCWRLLERPNFGLDFGGYRAGILLLGAALSDMKCLALLNDSVWYPVPGGQDFLRAALDSDVDVFGAVTNYGVVQPRLDAWQSMLWMNDPGSPMFHYCSFALHFGGRVLADPGFANFWRRFRLTDCKLTTVHRGEVGLSQWLLARGFSHAAMFDISDFDEVVAALSCGQLLEQLEGLVIPEEAPLRDLKHYVIGRYAETEAWRDEARRFLMAAVARTGPAYAVPGFALANSYPFLKKSPLRLDSDAARIMLAIIKDLPGKVGADMFAEAQAIVQGRRGASA
jgi:hypothetical protein